MSERDSQHQSRSATSDSEFWTLNGPSRDQFLSIITQAHSIDLGLIRVNEGSPRGAAGTTTWKGRNRKVLNEVCAVATEIGISSPRVIDIGPGGAMPLAQLLRPVGRKADWHWGQQALHAAVKLMDTVLRKSGLIDRVVTSEPGDVLDALSSLNPAALAIFDHNPAVIKATNSLIEQGVLPKSTSAHLHDFEVSIPPVEGDIFIAFNVITRRAIKPQVCADSLGAVIRPGGILALSHNRFGAIPSGFKQVRDRIFLKENG